MSKKELYEKIDSFLSQNTSPKDKLLLAYSGGPDSTALLNLLRLFQKKYNFFLALAHVDHGQRKESKQEALEVHRQAEEMGYMLHFKKLGDIKGNLENAYRNERLSFFSDLAKKEGYKAVLLAHHQDDLKETILKRFLEGSHFENLSAMEAVSQFEGLRLWRPLIEASKEELINWLNQHAIPYFTDKTNEDPKFLRARMRNGLFSSLEYIMGKKIDTSLLWMGKQALEYKNYLKGQVKSKLPIHEGPFGLYVDFTEKELHSLEIKYCLKDIAQKLKGGLSRSQLDEMAKALKERGSSKTWCKGALTLYTYQGGLFYLNPIKKEALAPLKIEPGIYQRGLWSIRIKEIDSNERRPLLGWRRIFQSEPSFKVIIPTSKKASLNFEPGAFEQFYFKKKVKKWWEEHKAPPFLRSLLPVIEVKNELYCELLTQKTPFEGSGLSVHLELAVKKH